MMEALAVLLAIGGAIVGSALFSAMHDLNDERHAIPAPEPQSEEL